jgi:hypothetical protein
MKQTASKEVDGATINEPSKPPENDQEYNEPVSDVSDEGEDLQEEEEEPKVIKKRKQATGKKVASNRKTTYNTTTSAKSIPQHHTTTLFNKCKVYDSNFNEDNVVFCMKNGTFIENHANKLLLSSVKHVVTVELPSMESNDELLARIRLVDALSDKEVFCTTSSSSRNKGQRVIFGQTINLFDHNTTATVATMLEFRFRESTSTNKRPYVMKLEIAKSNELLVCFYTEAFNVVWRDPAKKAKSRKHAEYYDADEDATEAKEILELTPYHRPSKEPEPKKARIEPAYEAQKTIPPPKVVVPVVTEEKAVTMSPTKVEPKEKEPVQRILPIVKKAPIASPKPKSSVLNNLAGSHQAPQPGTPYHRSGAVPNPAYYSQQPYPGYPGMHMQGGYYYPQAQGSGPPGTGSPQQYYAYPPYAYPPSYPVYGYPPNMMGPGSQQPPPQRSPPRKK